MRPSPASGANTADRVPDDDVDVAAPDALPLVVALAVGQAAVLDGHAIAEPRAEGRRHAGRERDLGHEHEHAAARRQRALGQPQVELRLAAAGHAVQERHVERPRVEPDAAAGRARRPAPA